MTKEAAQAQLEDAVYRALEAGMTADEITEEVRYAIESYEEN